MYIRNMQEPDLDFAAECTRMEGWRAEVREDFELFTQYDPSGCFIGIDQGQPAGICIATHYEEFGFIGELIVHPEKRGRGLGRQLLSTAIDYLRRSGNLTIYLDGVPRAVPLYERSGFHKLYPSLRFSGALYLQPGENVREMQTSDLSDVFRLDRLAFGADRSFILKQRFIRYPQLARVLDSKGRIQGFIMGKLREELVVAGPWIASDEAENPENLLLSIGSVYPGAPINLGVLDANEKAAGILADYGFEQKPNPPVRMQLGNVAFHGNPGMCFAIGSPANG